MNLPQTCPFCDAGVTLDRNMRQQRSDMRVVYECKTVIVDAHDIHRWQSDRCENAQKARAVDRVRELAARVAEMEAEKKDLRKRAELADGDIKRAQAILDASNTYIRRLEVELQSESQAKIDAEFHVAALKERLAELEARTREAEESNANALARLSAAEATIELRRIENEAARHQVWHAENVCDAMEKRVFDTDARCKRLEEAARAVYLDSIASDHPWTELETRNMHALRDVLEAKPCPHCLRVECECSEFDAVPDIGDK